MVKNDGIFKISQTKPEQKTSKTVPLEKPKIQFFDDPSLFDDEKVNKGKRKRRKRSTKEKQPEYQPIVLKCSVCGQTELAVTVTNVDTYRCQECIVNKRFNR